MNALQLYGRYIGVSVQAQMQYKISFGLQTLGHLGVTAIEFLGIWVLFARFGQLADWSIAEVALFYGLINMAFACADALGRGFDSFGKLVQNGDFDRLLLRPRSTVLQILGTELTLKRFGRLIQGLVIIGWSLSTLQIALTLPVLWLLSAAFVGSVALFCGIVIFQATLTFWTIESLEIMNILTYGGVETAQYPFSIYGRWFQRFFTFIVPLACVSYLPLLGVLNRASEFGVPLWVCFLSPWSGIVFLLLALRLWRIGERYYCSTGS
ncbi:MAG: ABC-2 family transporter protein [Synechococcales cyanobacterium C42_A2020_086]|jgi:ABC-2 type transport system permease protein|nr:ABC-2 family transporter protein [Synechococcales cyanobacterium C42_A2020_086]